MHWRSGLGLEALDVGGGRSRRCGRSTPAASVGATPPSGQVNRRVWWRLRARAGAMFHRPGRLSLDQLP
jgi:hypothetical protein